MIDVRNILESAFNLAWSSYPENQGDSPSSYQSIKHIVENAFDIDAVQQYVNQDVSIGETQHQQALQALAGAFARYLSDEKVNTGTIDYSTVLSAKQIMKSSAPCNIYPC